MLAARIAQNNGAIADRIIELLDIAESLAERSKKPFLIQLRVGTCDDVLALGTQLRDLFIGRDFIFAVIYRGRAVQKLAARAAWQLVGNDAIKGLIDVSLDLVAKHGPNSANVEKLRQVLKGEVTELVKGKRFDLEAIRRTLETKLAA